jgi:hypothetical protein
MVMKRTRIASSSSGSDSPARQLQKRSSSSAEESVKRPASKARTSVSPVSEADKRARLQRLRDRRVSYFDAIFGLANLRLTDRVKR